MEQENHDAGNIRTAFARGKQNISSHPTIHRYSLSLVMSLNTIFGSAFGRGIMYRGVPDGMTVENITRPTILNETDAVVRITTSALCGSNLHVYRGYQGGVPP